MLNRLFVYGTLRPGFAPNEIEDVVKTLTPIGKGSVRGIRYNLGAYPALKSSAGDRGRVQGEVFALPSGSDTLARIDEYEEFDPSNPAKSLFRRVKTNVTLEDGTRSICWVYIYNPEIPRKKMMLRKAHRRFLHQVAQPRKG